MNMSMVEAEESTLAILDSARQDGMRVIATIAVAFECPFDGATDPALVEAIAARFIDAGVEQIVIADTIGAGNPRQVRSLTNKLVSAHGAEQIA